MISLRPVKNYRESVDKIILTFEKKDNITYESEKISVPPHIIDEWKIYELIINYTNLLYEEKFLEGVIPITFKGEDIKKFYVIYDYYFTGEFELIKTRKFDKKFGLNGIYNVMSYIDGVIYYEYDDMWEIYPEFLQHLKKEASKIKELYGVNVM